MKTITITAITCFLSLFLNAQNGKYADVNGIKIYYEVYGNENAEPLLLLHYWTETSQMWKEHIEEFQKNYRVYVPDLRGHGKSPADLTDFVMKDSAEDMIALLNHLNIEKVKAIGVSYGGFTLLHMSTMKPELVQSMIVVGATHYWNQKQRDDMVAVQWETLKKEPWMKYLTEKHVNGIDQVEMMMTKFNSFKDDYTSMNFTPPILSTITANTLIVMGENDILGIDLAFEMHKYIPNSNLWILPNTGHTDPVHGKHIPEFLRISNEFLSGIWDN